MTNRSEYRRETARPRERRAVSMSTAPLIIAGQQGQPRYRLGSARLAQRWCAWHGVSKRREAVVTEFHQPLSTRIRSFVSTRNFRRRGRRFCRKIPGRCLGGRSAVEFRGLSSRGFHRSGVDNVISVSPKIGSHALRIEIAIDPPNSFSPSAGPLSWRPTISVSVVSTCRQRW
jgi:hypothetical protein